MQNVFYFLRSKDPSMQPLVQKELESLRLHSKKIDTVITQAYQIDQSGNVTGYTNQTMLDEARKHHIKTLVMVTNEGFKKKPTHEFLHDEKAQGKAIQSMLELCKTNAYQGVQMDFENINIDDKKQLTNFLIRTANALHKQHYLVSFAVVPSVSEQIQASAYLKKKYDNWSGAYDLTALGKAADFITLMTYDQHLSGTTPGPNAGYRWVEAVIQHSMKLVPANKLSLGIPTYSVHWYTGGHEHISVHESELSYLAAQRILHDNHAALLWNDKDKFHYAMYDHNWLYQYLFIEDAASFKPRIALAKKFKLNGISVFNLGNEDPGIWKSI